MIYLRMSSTAGRTEYCAERVPDFKREFTLSFYEQFFKDADYTDAEYIWCPGKVPCVVAVLHKKHDFRAASVFLRV